MSREPRWLSTAVVLAIHERLLAEHGGATGAIDEGRLESALASPRNHFAHGERDLSRLAATYAFAIAKDNPFRDGNKRLALTVAGVFPELNGRRLTATESDAVRAMLALAAGELDLDTLAAWLAELSERIAKPSRVRARPRTKKRRPRRS